MYKRFFASFLLLLIPLAAFVLIINIRVDSAFVINNRASQIARILVSGKNAAVKFIPSNWGSLQTAMVEEQKKKNDAPKDIVVFGTSRSSEISAGLFPKNTFYNCALPGGTILDYIALYGLYKRTNMLPKYLIISIDPSTFHSRKAVTVKKDIQYITDTATPLAVSKDLLPDYKNGINYLDITDNSPNEKTNYSAILQKIIGLFNLNYFQLNLAAIRSKMVFETDKDFVNSYFVIRKDGGYSLAQQSQIDSNAVIEKSKAFVDVQKSNYFVSSDTGNVYFQYFKKLLLNLKKDGVIPIVYTSPVNTIVFDNLSANMNVALENQIDLFCKQNGILTVGSFNPHKYGYNKMANYFIDSGHPVKSVVDNIFFHHRNELQAIGISLKDSSLETR